MLRKFMMAAAWAALVAGAPAYEWDNVGPDSRLGGRMISAGYLRGKVVLLDRRDYTDPANAEAIRQLQAIWATYKMKPFILLGSQNGPAGKAKVEETLRKLGVTFPVYRDARLRKPGASKEDLEAMERIFEDPRPLIQILDSGCRRKVYNGRDVHAAQGVVGSALLATSSPMTPKQFDYLLDYEIKSLPGRAYLRLKEYRGRFPKDAAKYAQAWEELSARDEVRKLAKLVELSRLVKDRDLAAKSSQRITPEVLATAMEKYAPLKQSADAFVVQEAKNALADLKFCAAALES